MARSESCGYPLASDAAEPHEIRNCSIPCTGEHGIDTDRQRRAIIQSRWTTLAKAMTSHCIEAFLRWAYRMTTPA